MGPTRTTWALREVVDLGLDVDFGAVYGAQWAWLRDETPSHVSLAVGSPITVSPPQRWDARTSPVS